MGKERRIGIAVGNCCEPTIPNGAILEMEERDRDFLNTAARMGTLVSVEHTDTSVLPSPIAGRVTKCNRQYGLVLCPENPKSHPQSQILLDSITKVWEITAVIKEKIKR